ncbi:unnamed protein product, partial [marine sediment metagenome]
FRKAQSDEIPRLVEMWNATVPDVERYQNALNAMNPDGIQWFTDKYDSDDEKKRELGMSETRARIAHQRALTAKAGPEHASAFFELLKNNTSDMAGVGAAPGWNGDQAAKWQQALNGPDYQPDGKFFGAAADIRANLVRHYGNYGQHMFEFQPEPNLRDRLSQLTGGMVRQGQAPDTYFIGDNVAMPMMMGVERGDEQSTARAIGLGWGSVEMVKKEGEEGEGKPYFIWADMKNPGHKNAAALKIMRKRLQLVSQFGKSQADSYIKQSNKGAKEAEMAGAMQVITGTGAGVPLDFDITPTQPDELVAEVAPGLPPTTQDSGAKAGRAFLSGKAGFKRGSKKAARGAVAAVREADKEARAFGRGFASVVVPEWEEANRQNRKMEFEAPYHKAQAKKRLDAERLKMKWDVGRRSAQEAQAGKRPSTNLEEDLLFLADTTYERGQKWDAGSPMRKKHDDKHDRLMRLS